MMCLYCVTGGSIAIEFNTSLAFLILQKKPCCKEIFQPDIYSLRNISDGWTFWLSPPREDAELVWNQDIAGCISIL